MADIELVIKIPEEAYKASHNINTSQIRFIQMPLKIIANGIPLPKGHGDLKDCEKLKHSFIVWSMMSNGFYTDADIAAIIYNSPTIVEAAGGEF